MKYANVHYLLAAVIILISGCSDSPASAQSTDEAAVSAVLDSLHSKASQADFDGYFDLYQSNAIFLGTDATERWTLDEFKEYTRPHFDRGNGWTYTSTSRHIYFSEDGKTAWFDELLDNNNLGITRGSGVLAASSSGWKFAQYNLTIPIPNELADQVVSQIRSNDQ